jgi:SAM-dependent methyltransferase
VLGDSPSATGYVKARSDLVKGAPEGVVSYWNGRARDSYDRQPGQDAAREVWATRVGPLIAGAVGSGARVLDIGCGTGFLARLLAADGHRISGQDVSRGMLEVAAERAAREGLAIEWSVGPAVAPPSGPFDAVVMRNVVWTLPDPGAALRALLPAMSPDGLVLISDAQWGAAEVDDGVTGRRFATCYARAAESLPLLAGIDFAHCAALVRSAGFGEVVEHTSLFERAPYPSAPGFFLLTARAPGADESVITAEGGGSGTQSVDDNDIHEHDERGAGAGEHRIGGPSGAGSRGIDR